MAKQDITVCIDAHPKTDNEIFRIAAADDVLRLLADAHESEFSIPELVETTDVARSTVWRAVDLLDSIGVVQMREAPQRNYISIDPNRLQKDDPVLAIPQAELHDPIRAFVDAVEQAVVEAEDIAELVGIVVFGSVARGEADRQSDIDCFVVVDGDRTIARRRVTDIVATLQTERFDGDRFVYEPYVESVDSAHRAGSKLREIVTEGVTVYESDQFHALRTAVITDE